jgi:hypothetical protein
VAPDAPFPFVQFEFGFPLGPDDGRYLRRAGEDRAPERVIVLSTLGAPHRRLLRGRRRPVATGEETGPAPLPTVRATLIHAEPLASAAEADRWLDRIRRDPAAADAEVDDAARELNSVLRAHRAAAADPYVREVSRSVANVVRVGYGSGDLVADGRFAAAYELTADARRGRSAEAMAPLERLAAVLSGTEEVGVAEELVLRARLDLDADRPREAALQARIALEALLAEPADDEASGALDAHRQAVGEAANAALHGEIGPALEDAVAEAVTEMRRALHRSSGRF